MRMAKEMRYTCFMRKIFLPALIFIASLTLYIATLAPTVVTIFDDSLELQLAVPTLAIIHPTGYPLYELLAWLTTRLIPMGDAAYRVNLFSALAAAMAIVLFFLTARRLGAKAIPALVATFMLAVSPVWWSQATIAEVYSFQGAITLLIFYAFLRWSDAPPEDRPLWLMVGALAVGLGLAHHRLTFLLFPALLLFLVWTDNRLFVEPKRWGAPLLVMLLPLATYVLLPLRAHVGSLDGTYADLGFWKWILGGGYGSAFIVGNPFGIDRTPTDLLLLARDQFGWIGVFFVFLSAKWWMQHPKRALLLAGVALADFVFASVYKVQDIQVFLIPLFIVMALWIALGLDALWRLMTSFEIGRPGAQPWLRALVAGVLLLWPVRSTLAHWEEADRSQPPARAWAVHDYGLDMLSSAAPDGRVVGLLGEMTLIRYFQYDRRLAPMVQTIAADDDALRLSEIEKSVIAGRPTLTTRPLAKLPERYSLGAQGALIRVWPAGEAPAWNPRHRMHEQLTPEVSLIGWEVISRTPRSGPSLRVMLWWQAGSSPLDFKVSTRLLTPDGSLLAQQDGYPVYNAYPGIYWRENEIVLDAYNLALQSLPETETTLLVILYDPLNGKEYGRWQTALDAFQ